MKKVLGILLCLIAAPAQAMYLSSADLEQRCASEKQEDLYACMSYIAGVIDYHTMMLSLGTAPTIEFCLPADTSLPQAAGAVMAYLKAAPQHEDFIAAGTVPLALNKVFPCEKGK